MDAFDRLLSATAADFRYRLLQHPLADRLRRGELGFGHYLAWLRETWHLVRHTPAIFMQAAARTPESRGLLRDWFLEQAEEERGHDLLCVRDIERLGIDAAPLLATPAGAGVRGLVAQDWAYAAVGMPVGLLGASSLSEEVGATLAAPAMAALQAALGLPAAALGFMRSHGQADRKHFEDARRAVCTLVRADEFDELVTARRRAIGHCAQLLDDVLASAVPVESIRLNRA